MVYEILNAQLIKNTKKLLALLRQYLSRWSKTSQHNIQKGYHGQLYRVWGRVTDSIHLQKCSTITNTNFDPHGVTTSGSPIR